MTVTDRMEYLTLSRRIAETGADEKTMRALWHRLEELGTEPLGDEVEFKREPVRLWLK